MVKEERGNKGAALTTYISLAGRYCVLMPNTARGGGISRKITNANARKKLKKIIDDLEIRNGMGVIMRTAGTERSKAEIRRDFEYLSRTWDEVRERTFNSIAPALVYEDASLIKRAIRDLYTRDVEEVLVDGMEAYQTAKKYMRMLMPSHAKRVQRYRETDIPLFHRYQIEGQLDAIHSAEVQLKSGGYLVIQATEALVSIDVNSGRSTRERNIEETAVNTNVEAADEIARQLRLRDLAGLVVIDFIDMQENRNLRQVERRLKEAMKADRARIQIGRISGFGLLELSRQRLRPSLQEASTQTCPHCRGAGFVRSTESMALQVLRALEEEGIRHRLGEVTVSIPGSVALYVLNNKRAMLADIESRYGFRVTLLGDDSVIPPDMRIERVRAAESDERPPAAEAETDKTAKAAAEDGEKKRPRRRRSRRKPAAEAVAEPAAETTAQPPEEAVSEETGRDRRRRRRRREAARPETLGTPGGTPAVGARLQGGVRHRRSGGDRRFRDARRGSRRRRRARIGSGPGAPVGARARAGRDAGTRARAGRDSGTRARAGRDAGTRARAGRDSGTRARAGRDAGTRARAGRDTGTRARAGRDAGTRARAGRDSGTRARAGRDTGTRARAGRDAGTRARAGRDSGTRARAGRDTGTRARAGCDSGTRARAGVGRPAGARSRTGAGGAGRGGGVRIGRRRRRGGERPPETARLVAEDGQIAGAAPAQPLQRPRRDRLAHVLLRSGEGKPHVVSAAAPVEIEPGSDRDPGLGEQAAGSAPGCRCRRRGHRRRDRTRRRRARSGRSRSAWQSGQQDCPVLRVAGDIAVELGGAVESRDAPHAAPA